MKTIYSTILLVIMLNTYCVAQTELPYSKYLLEKYNINLTTKQSYSTMEVLADKSKENVFAFVSGSSDITYNGQNIAAVGNAIILLQFKTSTGELVWSTSLGNSTVPLYKIESAIKTPDGNICIGARGVFQTGVPLILGSQSFAVRADMKPTMVFATFNTTTHLWSKVKFLYAPDQQGMTATPMFDEAGNFYICGTVISSALYVNNTQVASVGTISGNVIYAYKENPEETVIYKKQTTIIDSRTSFSTVMFEVDNSGNLFIAGDISYIHGAMGIDGVVVKNDTLSNSYDYSYSDIYLFKIAPAGSVKFGKTYLFSGNEAPRYLKALANGTIYLCGEYNGLMKNFPGLSGGQFYNRFIANISGNDGTFNWSYPINSNVYYSDRFLFNTGTDEAENLYFTANFCPNTIDFMGQTFTKRNVTNGTSNTLVAKITPAGTFEWGNVIGPVTTFPTSYIDNPRVEFFGVGSWLILQVPNLSYGSNMEFAWGKSASPTTTIQHGYQGIMAVVDEKTGNIVKGYSQKFTKTIELDAENYFAIRNNFLSWDIARLTTQATNSVFLTKVADNELIVYPNPVGDEIFIENLPSTTEPLFIYNIYGNLVKKLNGFEDKFSVKNLPNGIYTMKAGNRISRFLKIK